MAARYKKQSMAAYVTLLAKEKAQEDNEEPPYEECPPGAYVPSPPNPVDVTAFETPPEAFNPHPLPAVTQS